MPTTHHQLISGSLPEDGNISPESVHLVVTSPPYPMIEMWDESFASQDVAIGAALAAEDGERAFELMHRRLDEIWQTCHGLLCPGGLICVNVGDATRKFGGDFQLYSNHSRTVAGLRAAGFQLLPEILWRKPTNAPNKFMGSGMLPAGAYITYEHEFIIIARRGGKRVFNGVQEKAHRRQSAFFWEERNQWFSDLWQGVTGTSQRIDKADRKRSGAFPLEIPSRLIDMFSVQGDTVLDPFAGTGTTMAAAAAAGRSSIGVEREKSLLPLVRSTMETVLAYSTARTSKRLSNHLGFVEEQRSRRKGFKHANAVYQFPVVTAQEKQLALPSTTSLEPCYDGLSWDSAYEVGADLRPR